MEVDDLLLEIFLRLPSQSIQRFITACKQWHSLITNPTFRKLWRKRNLKPPTGLFVRCRITRSTYFVPFSSNIQTTPHIRANLRILQSCNGLLLCTSESGIRTGCFVYYVYNPTTYTYHTLPEVDGTNFMTLVFAFDPNRSPHYKVCCISGEWPYCSVNVYSSDMHCWKSVPISPDRYVISRGVYWNGAIHWMCVSMYFEIKNETFKKMPSPSCHAGTRSQYFGESCERLSCAWLCESELGKSYNVYVYELKRDYSEWVFKYHVEVDDRYSILSVVHGVEEDDDSFLVLAKGERIVQYSLLSKTFVELKSITGEHVDDEAFQYIESQCAWNADCGIDKKNSISVGYE